MALTIKERLKDLRVERGLTLEQLAEQTGLSKSALGSYEADDFKDISHYALIKLARFYGVTADYLLGLTETKSHPNAGFADLRLSDERIDLLKSGRIDTALLCELAAHPDFVKLLVFRLQLPYLLFCRRAPDHRLLQLLYLLHCHAFNGPCQRLFRLYCVQIRLDLLHRFQQLHIPLQGLSLLFQSRDLLLCRCHLLSFSV